MAKVSETYAGQFVTGAELQPLGQRRSAVIHTTVQEVVGQENAAPKIILDLVSKQGIPWPRRVVLNKTNAIQLAAAFGDDTDDWTGKPIEIWGEMVNFKGKFTPGIKIAPTPMAALKAPAAPQPASPQPPASGNGATADHTASGAPLPVVDDDLNDAIPF